jgi:hypothetical protein
MARISTYPIISTPTVDDLLIGTDVNDLNITKNFTIGEIGQLIGQDYVPYIGATGNVNLGLFNITSGGFIVGGGTASQFLKADGSLDSTSYTPQTRTLTINGTTYNLSANRSWNLNTLDSLTTIGTGGAATYIGKVLNIPVYQAQGNYITQLSGEATAVGPGNATVTLDNTAVISKILSGLNVTGGTILATDTILQAFGKVQNQINALAGGVEYQGTWNAATNTPFLQSSVGVQGHYYVVNVAGNTNLNGVTDWQVGDWAIYNGSAWEKVDNTDAVVSVNGYTGAVVLTSSDVGAVPTTRTITINGVGYNLNADRSWTVGDVRTDQSYINPSWIASLAWSKITGTPTTLAGYGITDGALNTRTLTINGTTYDLTANRTWNVGTVTSIGTSGPLTGGTIIGSGTIGITQAGASSDGYLSSSDWNTFNSKQSAFSTTAPLTFSLGVLGITQATATIDGYLSSTDWATFNSKVGGSGTANTLPMWGTASSLINSPLSYAADAFNFQYNSATGGTVNFTNIGLTPYTYSIQMNNFGSPRSTVHSYTDGVVIQSIAGSQVSRIFADGNLILGTSSVNTGHKLTISGDLYVDTIVNAIADTDRFIVSDGGIIKYRTGAEILSDIGAQGALTLTTIGTSGPATLISNTLNIPDYGSALTGYVPYTGATQNVNLGEFGISAGYFQADLTPTQAAGVGRLIWNNADGTLNLRLLGGNVDLHLGQQQYARIVNGTGGNVLRSNYQVVKIIGAQGQRMQVGLARADNDFNSKDTIGLIAENINNNNEGFVVSSGLIEEINTTGSLQGETWTDGDTLYLSGTIFGALTNIKPTAPIHTVIVGFVVYAHANHGKIFVKIDNGYELEELHDVSAEPFVNNGLLYRDTTLNLWKSATISTILGYTPAPQGNYITSLTGEATASGPGAASVTLSNSAVTGKVLTGLNITGNAILSTDSILTAFGKLQNQVNQLVGGLQYEGTWNASTNTPTITSSVGTDGTFYIVNVAGTTNINGINDWEVGDWIVFHDTAWQKVDNSDSVSSVFGRVGNIVANQSDYSAFYPLISDIKNGILTVQGSGVLSGSGTFSANQATNNTITLTHAAVSRTDTTSAQSPSFGGSFTAIDSVTSSAEGHITAINTKTITVPSTIATATQAGLLSSADWITFNGKQNAITLTTTGTTGPATLIGATLNIPNYTPDLSGYVTLGTDQTITGLKTILRGGDVLNFKIGTDTLYGLKVAYNQNELVPSGEATWSFVNTFNRNGVGYETTPISFFRGVLVTGERLLSASINTNLLDYYSNNPSGRYPVYAYNTGVQQFSTGIIVGNTTGVVNAVTGAIADLPAGVVANFNGRVIGGNAVNSNEFVTLSQVSGYVPTSRTITINGTTQDLSANRTFNVGTVTSVTASSPLASSGGTTPNITISQSSGSTNGFLSSTDWTTFNNKANANGSNASGTWGISITGNATYALNSTRLYASDAPYTYGGSSPYYMYMNYDGGSYWELKVSPATPGAVRVAYANSAGSAASASSVPWSGVTSKPSYLMYYQGFTLDANTMDTNATGFTYSVNAPYTGPIARFSANSGYDLWLNAPYGGDGYGLAFRTRNGDTGTFNSWKYPAVYNVNVNGGGALYATIYYDQNNTAYYVDPASGSRMNSITYDNLYFSGDSTYGFLGRNVYADTINGRGSDALELNYYDGGEVHIGAGYSKTLRAGALYTNGSVYGSIFYDSQNTGFYVDPSGSSVFNNSITTTNINGGLRVTSSGTATTQATIAIQQVTGEGDTIIFADYEPYAEYGIIARNAIDSIDFTSGTTSNSIDNYTITNRSGSARTAYVKARINLAGGISTFGDARAPIFYDSNDTSYFVNPNGQSNLYFVNAPTGYVSNGNPWGTSNSAWFPNGITTAGGTNWIYGTQTYIGNAPSNGAGHEFFSSGSSYSTGNMEANGSMRAPIFYDRNDTSRYLDPSADLSLTVYGEIANSSFAVGSMQPGALNIGRTDTNYGWDGTTWYSDVRAGILANCSETWEFVIHDSGDSVESVFRYDGGDQLLMGRDIGWGTLYIEAARDFRAPIFYDSNNTGYYVNPASSSNLITLTVADWVYQNSSGGMYWNPYSRGIASPENGGNSYGTIATVGSGRNGWSGYGIDSRWVLMSTGGDNIGIHDNSNSWLYYWNGGNHTFSRGYMQNDFSMRSPIFYDSNNTSYYIDAASTSVLHTLLNIGGWLEVRSNVASTNPTTESGLFFGWNKSGGNGEANIIVDGGANTGQFLFQRYNGGGSYTNIFQADIYGLTANSGTVSVFSDIRLKTNITNASPKLNDLMKLNVVNYEFVGEYNVLGKQLGFIAQEVEQIFPSLVREQDTRQYDEQGNYIKGYEDTKILKVGMEFAMLVKAMQEQQSIIDSLKSEIETLKQK